MLSTVNILQIQYKVLKMKGLFQNLSKKALKAKGLLGAVIVTAGATASQAAVTVGENGTLSGSLDMAGYNSALTIVIGATVAIVIGGIIIRTIKKV